MSLQKEVLFDMEALEKIQQGVNKISKAVSYTLGANGRNIIISQSFIADYGLHSLPIRPSKDGFTVAKHFNLSDTVENIGVLMVKEAIQRTVDEAGDGTTTSCVLTNAIVNEGIKLIKAGANPMQLKKGIDEAVEYVISELQKMASPVGDDINRIREVATVSANNDKEIGDLIADAFQKIGKDGVIDVEESTNIKTEIKVTEGFQFDEGFISPYFITNPAKNICELENPYILLYDRPIAAIAPMLKLLQQIQKEQRALLIVCMDSDAEGLAALISNKMEGRLKVCAVKSPFGALRQEMMEDMAILTGGQFIVDTKGVSLENVTTAHLGTAKKVVVTKKTTTIIGGQADKERLEDLLNDLRMNVAGEKDNVIRGTSEKRIARLTGGVAAISVGAPTEVEMKEKKDRLDDAVRATQCAITEGYLPGGGTAFLKVVRVRKEEETSVGKGFKLIMDIMDAPLRQILKNAGIEGEEQDAIVNEVMAYEGYGGYNALTGKVENLLDSGIIDPVKVLRNALLNASSAATMILTSGGLICDKF